MWIHGEENHVKLEEKKDKETMLCCVCAFACTDYNHEYLFTGHRYIILNQPLYWIVLDHFWCLVLVCLWYVRLCLCVCYKAKQKKKWINSSEPPHVLLYHLYSDYWCQLQRTLLPQTYGRSHRYTLIQKKENYLLVLIGIEAKNMYIWTRPTININIIVNISM